MEFTTSIYFVRHGHVHNPQDVFYGRLPGFPLSEKGRNQAAAAAELLKDKPLSAAFSSPLLRAQQTAKIILKSHNDLTLHITQDLNEAYTPFDGYPRCEMIARNWDVYTGTDPQYEQPDNILKRVQEFVKKVRQLYPGPQHILAVTHGDVIAYMRLWANGISIKAKDKQEDYPVPASVSTLVFQPRNTDEVCGCEYVIPYP